MLVGSHWQSRAAELACVAGGCGGAWGGGAGVRAGRAGAPDRVSAGDERRERPTLTHCDLLVGGGDLERNISTNWCASGINTARLDRRLTHLLALGRPLQGGITCHDPPTRWRP